MRCCTLGAVALALMAAGCGTVENFAVGRHGRTIPYGGTRIAADKFLDPYDVEMAWVFVFGPFWVADIGLSAVADTLTLPVAWAAGWRHIIGDYYFPQGKPGDQPAPAGERPAAEPISPSPSPPTPAPFPATPSAGR